MHHEIDITPTSAESLQDPVDINLDEGGTVRIGAVTIPSGAIRHVIAITGQPATLTRGDCAAIAGALLAPFDGQVTRASLPCGHPASCEGLAGPNGDQPGCGWCADIADNAMLIDHLSRTYDHFSRGRISKPNTHPEEVFRVADDLATEEMSEAIREALEAEGEKGEAATPSDSGGRALMVEAAELARRERLAEAPK